MEIVAACKEDRPTREAITGEGRCVFTHEDHRDLLDPTDCDIIMVGDYLGRRGGIIIDCLERSRQVFTDKPMCTSLEEPRTIGDLKARARQSVGMMLDLRDSRTNGAREVMRKGGIGDELTISFGGQGL